MKKNKSLLPSFIGVFLGTITAQLIIRALERE